MTQASGQSVRLSDSAEDAEPAGGSVPLSAWLLLALLTSLNVLNFLVRQLIPSLAPLLISDLGLTRAQIGSLAGFAFVVVYSIVGLVLGVFADRWPRRRLIAGGLTLWSAMTALSGAAHIVHATASAEESAYLAVELARGVPYRAGRSRYEVPWREVTTIAQCRERLEESRRMRLASLDMWPRLPHLDNSYIVRDDLPPYNAFARFVGGLRHDDAHFEQIDKIVAQARAARRADPGS